MPSRSIAPPGPLCRAAAAILRRALEATGRSQTWLGGQAGISQSQISKYLRGERCLDLNQLEAICVALNLRPTDVVREADIARR